jgi:hypothetical protein
MALYKNKSDDKIYFYDPNAKHGRENVRYGERQIANLDELIDTFWQASDPENFLAGFGGFDPVDWALRCVTIEVYRFSEDPQFHYSLDNTFNLSSDELVSIFNEFPFLSKLANRNAQVQSLIRSLDKKQALEFFKRNDVSLELKKDLKVHCAFLSDEKDTLTKKVSSLVCQEHEARDVHEIKRLTDEALEIKEWLTLDDALLVLALNPGNSSLAEELLNASQDKRDTEWQGFALTLAIGENINQHSLETAKIILKIVGEKFKVSLSFQQIWEFKNAELAQFMLENFKDHYLDPFGTCKLEFLPQLIALQCKKDGSAK